MQTVSIGVMAYNEEANIGHLLSALQQQKMTQFEILEVITVSSGSTDRTDEIVQSFVDKDPRFRLIVQKERRGKSSAINLFLQEAKGELCVMESADTIPFENTIEELLLPLQNPEIGMVGSHPMPVNDRSTCIGFAVNMLWDLHHKMALLHPKAGELVSFRNIVDKIPEESAVDEASIEAEIRLKGLGLAYAAKAYVQNKGPENSKDFLKQRRRIYAGHLWLEQNFQYRVATQNGLSIFKLLLQNMEWNPAFVSKTLFTIFLEVYGRFLGWFDFHFKKRNPYKWDIASSTKQLKKEGVQ